MSAVSFLSPQSGTEARAGWVAALCGARRVRLSGHGLAPRFLRRATKEPVSKGALLTTGELRKLARGHELLETQPGQVPPTPPWCGHTCPVATVTTVTVQRSGPAVRASLAEHAPAECSQFEAELRDALARASADLDLTRVDAVLTRWHARATIVANPLTPVEEALVQRARAGDFTGLLVRGDDGAWTTL